MSPCPSRSVVRTCALALLLVFVTRVGAQDQDFRYINNTYVDYIKTVRLHVNGFPHSYPIITLNGGAVLRLSFDDLSDEVRRYSYRYIHCDQDWTPSGLSPLEYNPGYSKDYLEDFDFSLRTLAEYVHYDLYFPNRNMPIIASGNYLLVVYDEENESFPIITRRFMVSENLVGVSARTARPAAVDKIHSHQEIDAVLNVKQLDLRAPMREMSLTVLQNGRWDNAVIGVRPNLLGKEQLQFNYQDKIVFQAANEFRNLDIRSVQTPRTRMSSITNEGDFYAMMSLPERGRDNGAFLNYFDLNGDFVNFRFDRPVLQLADEFLAENFDRLRFDFNGEYVEMTFVYDSGGQPLDEELYVFGGLTEWQLKERFRMVWNPSINMYVGRALVKQGFYNYHYVTARPAPAGALSKDRISYVGTEGSYDETENDYIVLAYYRPIGGRYDRLVGSRIINSNVE